jgi:hypothetical protein
MQQARNAAESAFIRPIQLMARKPAGKGAGFEEIVRQPGDRGAAIAGSARLKIAFPAPFKAVLEPAQHIEARIT